MAAHPMLRSPAHPLAPAAPQHALPLVALRCCQLLPVAEQAGGCADGQLVGELQ
jgi:hypothetical protein